MFYIILDDPKPEITDERLLDQSKFISNESDLRKIAITGLNMTEDMLKDERGIINDADYAILREWRTKAETDLCNALKKVGMN